MVRINLLSEQEKRKRASGAAAAPALRGPSSIPLPLLGGILLLVLLAGAVYLYFNESRQLGLLADRIDAAKQDSTRYSRAITKIREIETSQSAIAARIQAIQAVDRGRFRWPHIMAELSRTLPDNTWLTSVSQSAEAQSDDRIEITGVTFSNLTLTEFMTNLESSPYLADVTLVGSTRSTLQGVDVTAFSLVATYTDRPSS